MGALTNYDRAIQLEPDFAEAFLDRGALRDATSEIEGAMADYNRAIDLRPELSPAYFSRGTINYSKGNLDAALADYENAARIASNEPLVFRMLGYVSYDRHDFTKALAAFRRACELDPNDDYAHFRIYLIRSRLGEALAARDELKDFLDRRGTEDMQSWQSGIGKFLIGKVTEERLFEAAQDLGELTSPARRCEAWFYAGTVRLIAGDRRTAAKYFEQCNSTGQKNVIEYLAASAERNHLMLEN